MDAKVVENFKLFVIGRGFLGMLVIACPKCGNLLHMKPVLGLTHVCTKEK